MFLLNELTIIAIQGQHYKDIYILYTLFINVLKYFVQHPQCNSIFEIQFSLLLHTFLQDLDVYYGKMKKSRINYFIEIPAHVRKHSLFLSPIVGQKWSDGAYKLKITKQRESRKIIHGANI